MYCTRCVLLTSVLLSIVNPCRAGLPHAFEAGVWLEGKSLQLIRNSRVTMNDGAAAFLPQAGAGYDAFWLRDYAYMLEGSPEAFSDAELRDACLVFIHALRDDGAAVDCVRTDGTPLYMPGYGTMGENPVADGSQFTVDVAWRTYQRLKDDSLLNQMIDPLVQTMNAVPRNPATGLVHIDPAKAWDRCPYGFTDSIRKTGDVLFCSLLDTRASRELADLLESAGRASEAATWRDAAEAKTTAIRDAFWDPTTGLFNAATVQCNQPDIWGSAFAVELGVATPEQSQTIAQYFKDHYSELVLDGQIRQLPGGTYWQVGCTPDTYQNGGFWGVANGWFVGTLRLADPQLAEQTVLDMVDHYRDNGVFEWTNGVQVGAGNYVSSASLPLSTLRRLYSLPSAPVLKEVGGAFLPDNLAAMEGVTTFAKDTIDGYEEHSSGHLIDGIYGNDHSWIAGSDQSFIGLAFSQPIDFNSIAFGRDNTGEYMDRYTGIYTFQYTTNPNPNALTPDSDWISFGVVYLDALYPDASGHLRHRYEFAPIAGATGLRILVDGASIGIDELEVYSLPEPKTLGLLLSLAFPAGLWLARVQGIHKGNSIGWTRMSVLFLSMRVTTHS